MQKKCLFSINLSQQNRLFWKYKYFFAYCIRIKMSKILSRNFYPPSFPFFIQQITTIYTQSKICTKNNMKAIVHCVVYSKSIVGFGNLWHFFCFPCIIKEWSIVDIFFLCILADILRQKLFSSDCHTKNFVNDIESRNWDIKMLLWGGFYYIHKTKWKYFKTAWKTY